MECGTINKRQYGKCFSGAEKERIRGEMKTNGTEKQKAVYEPASMEIIPLETGDVVTSSTCPSDDSGIILPYVPFP